MEQIAEIESYFLKKLPLTEHLYIYLDNDVYFITSHDIFVNNRDIHDTRDRYPEPDMKIPVYTDSNFKGHGHSYFDRNTFYFIGNNIMFLEDWSNEFHTYEYIDYKWYKNYYFNPDTIPAHEIPFLRQLIWSRPE